MTTGTSTKMPRMRLDNQARFASAVVRGTTATFTHHRHHIKTHKLPGIGTYVIDTPKDANLTAREKCFRYQEIHRGVSRSKLKSLPDIPKRYDMKPLPVAKLREMHRTMKSPFDEGGREIHTPNVSENGSIDDGRSDRSRKQDPTWKLLPSQEELVSRSPIGKMESAVTGFGVRKNKLPSTTKLSRQHREFTYLSTNLALSEPEPVMVKATERELESQAEYRKQLSFYLNQMLNSENPTPQPDTKLSQRSPSLGDEANNKDRDVPYDYVGYSSKNLEWERKLRLGDMLINTTPDLRKKLKLDEKSSKAKDGSGSKKETKSKKRLLSISLDTEIIMGKRGSCNDIHNLTNTKLKDSARSNTFLNNVSQNTHQNFGIKPSSSILNLKRSNSFTEQQPEDSSRRRATVTVPAGSSNKIEIVHHDEDGEEYYDNDDDSDDDDNDDNDDDDDDDDDDDAEKWREVANMPVVESGGYDRYANVKLPSWGRTHTKGKEQKHSVPTQASRNASHNNMVKGGASLSKNNSPSGLS